MACCLDSVFSVDQFSRGRVRQRIFSVHNDHIPSSQKDYQYPRIKLSKKSKKNRLWKAGPRVRFSGKWSGMATMFGLPDRMVQTRNKRWIEMDIFNYSTGFRLGTFIRRR